MARAPVLRGIAWIALAALLAPLAEAAAAAPAPPRPALLFCGESQGNDLYQAAARQARAGAAAAVRWVPAEQCASEAAQLPNRSGVLFLADGAPARQPALPAALLDLLRRGNVRLFAEYVVAPPAAGFAGLDAHPCPDFTRLVAHPGSPLWSARTHTQPLDVLEPNACMYIPYWPAAAEAAGGGAPGPTPGPHLVLAKVAGFARSVFGLNNTDSIPVLTTPPLHPGMLLSSLPLSAVRRARYAPAASWRGLWRDLLRWLLFGDDGGMDALHWTPVVGPAYADNATLPAGAAVKAVKASMRWTHTVSRLLPTPSSYAAASALGLWGKGLGGAWLAANGWPAELTPLGCKDEGGGGGDGSSGIYEAYMSAIQPRGGGVGGNLSTQLVRPVVRTDCVGEAAGGLAVGAWAEFADARATAVAANLLDFLFFNSTALAAWPRSDPASSVGGTLLWGACCPVVTRAPCAVCPRPRADPCATCPRNLLRRVRAPATMAFLAQGGHCLTCWGGGNNLKHAPLNVVAGQRRAPVVFSVFISWSKAPTCRPRTRKPSTLMTRHGSCTVQLVYAPLSLLHCTRAGEGGLGVVATVSRRTQADTHSHMRARAHTLTPLCFVCCCLHMHCTCARTMQGTRRCLRAR